MIGDGITLVVIAFDGYIMTTLAKPFKLTPSILTINPITGQPIAGNFPGSPVTLQGNGFAANFDRLIVRSHSGQRQNRERKSGTCDKV